LMSGHNNMVNFGCTTCHQSIDTTFPVFTDNSAGHNGLSTTSCVGCHGREEDMGHDVSSQGRGAGLRLAGAAALCYGILILLPVATGTTVVLLAFLLLRAPFWSAVSTLPFPFGAIGAERAVIGQGAVVGMLNLAWGVSNTAGPLLAGAVADSVGLRAAYLPALAACVLVGSSILVLAARAPTPALEPVTESA